VGSRSSCVPARCAVHSDPEVTRSWSTPGTKVRRYNGGSGSHGVQLTEKTSVPFAISPHARRDVSRDSRSLTPGCGRVTVAAVIPPAVLAEHIDDSEVPEPRLQAEEPSESKCFQGAARARTWRNRGRKTFYHVVRAPAKRPFSPPLRVFRRRSSRHHRRTAELQLEMPMVVRFEAGEPFAESRRPFAICPSLASASGPIESSSGSSRGKRTTAASPQYATGVALDDSPIRDQALLG